MKSDYNIAQTHSEETELYIMFCELSDMNQLEKQFSNTCIWQPNTSIYIFFAEVVKFNINATNMVKRI